MKRFVEFVFKDGQSVSLSGEESKGGENVRAHFDGAVDRIAHLFLFSDLNVYIEPAAFENTAGWECLASKLGCTVTVF